MLVRIMTSWDGGDIEPDPDGFVHLSWAEQVEGTIRRHHPDASELTLLVIDEAALPPGALRAEASTGGAAFPHLYATLPASAVGRAVPWRQGAPLPLDPSDIGSAHFRSSQRPEPGRPGGGRGRGAVGGGIWHPRGTGSTEERQMDEGEKEQISKTAGVGAGMLGGARVGQAVIPIPVLGSFAGAVLGGVVGSEVGKRLGKAIINGATAFVETLKDSGTPSAASEADSPEP